MPLIKGEHICPICKGTFQWHYILHEKVAADAVIVSEVSKDSRRADVLKRENPTTYIFRTYCSHCGNEIYFEAQIGTKIMYI